MDDELDTLAALVGDVLAWALAVEQDGGDALPMDVSAGSSPPEVQRPPVTQPVASRGPLPPPAARPAPVTPAAVLPRPPRPEPPRAAPAATPSAPSSAPPEPRPAGPPVAPALFATPAAPPSEAAPGLFGVPGKWASWRVDPEEQLAALRAARPARCPECGQGAHRTTGPTGARLMVLAVPMAGEADEMFERMLVRVLRLERSDVLMAEARSCSACADALRAEVRLLKPKLVLAMGDVARALVGAAVGTWCTWEESGALGTLHPTELLSRPDDKRAVFGHLQELERRL